MHHYFKHSVLIALIFIISACNQSSAPATSAPTTGTSSQFYVEPAALTLFLEQEFLLSLHNLRGDVAAQSIEWFSSNSNVVSVHQGKVRAHKLGEARIEALLNGKTQSITVRVLPKAQYAANSIQGMLWLDANNNHHVDDNETILRNQALFIDSNRNGRHDSSEPLQHTDTRGHYSFPYLASGNYPLVTLLPQGYRHTDNAPLVSATQSLHLHTTMVTADNNWYAQRVLSEQGFDGVVTIQIRDSNGDAHACTGALLYGGYHIITAAHCLAHWQDIRYILFSASNAKRQAQNVYIHPEWHKDDNSNDIAIIELESPAPYEAERYGIYRTSDEVMHYFVRVGYGAVGSGHTGEETRNSAKLRGYNRYDDTNIHFRRSMQHYDAPIGSQLSYDFDDGNSAHDAFGYYFNVHDIGLGKFEATAAKGDSGSPAFIDGEIAGISSFSIAFTNQKTDIDSIPLNKSFGEFAVDTRVSYYQHWIDEIIQQSTHTLMASQLVRIGDTTHTIVNFPLQSP